MRICVVGLRGFPHVMGGVETHCEELFPRLKKLRPRDSFTVIGRRRYLTAQRFEYEGVRVVGLGHSNSRYLETVTNAARGMFYARFIAWADVVHIQGIGAAATAIPLAKLLRMKVITTYHSKNYEHAKWGVLARLVFRFGEWLAVRWGDHVVCVSKSLERELKRRFSQFESKIQFIPNGAEHLLAGLDGRAGDVTSRYGLTNCRYIISVGRLVPEKGLHDLVEAFTLAQLPDCKLVIVGEADHKDDYARRLRARASERIVFTGFMPRDCIGLLLRSSSLFVLPSYNEGMPIAALEAIVAGCPVLLSDIEPNRDLELPVDCYFARGSVGELCHKLQAKHERYRVEDRGLLERYSWAAACGRMDKLYSSIEAGL